MRWALDSWWLDIKLGIRMLAKYPGLALAGVTGIAVAVAIAVGAYSFIYGAFLVPAIPLEEGDRIVSIEIWDAAAGRPELRSLYDYNQWREGLTSIPEIGAFRILMPNLIASGVRPESVRVASMSASGFAVARVRPLMGRYLQPDDERDGAPSVVVIGEDVWRSRFASDPGILGRTIQLGATRYAIVGVMPKGFAFPINDHIWIPLRTSLPSEPRSGPELMVFGRLAPGATRASAQAEVTAVGQRTAQAFPKLYAQLRPQVLPYARGGDDASGLLVTQGALVSMLVLVCLNVAILVYTRTAMRQAEIGLRTALGASRGRIVVQFFIEAFVLSTVGALAGVAIAAAGLRQINAVLAPVASDFPFWISIRLSAGAVVYALALSVLAAAIVGIVPALQATGRSLQSGLRIVGTSGLRLGKTWTVLIIAQVTFAVAILPPALSSVWEDTMDGIAGVGFAADEFLSAQLAMDSTPAITSDAAARSVSRQGELLRRLEAEPAVSAVTFAMFDPGNEGNARIEAEGASQTQTHQVRFNRVDVGFFGVFEVPLVAGRGLEAGDVGDGSRESEAVVVNLSFARRVFGGDALGRRIRYVDRSSGVTGQGAESGRWYEIVGIVSDFPTGASQGMRDTAVKVYHAVAPGRLQAAAIALRMRERNPSAFGERLREIAVAVDPDLQLRNIRPLDEVLKSEQWISRLQAALIAGVTVSVLMLSSAGIFALMSFTVSQRRKEIGIRIALGADRKRIVAGIFSRALLQLSTGAAIGLFLAVVFERGSGGILLRGNAALVLPAVAIVMVTMGFLAALGPARRSLRIEPTEALRDQ